MRGHRLYATSSGRLRQSVQDLGPPLAATRRPRAAAWLARQPFPPGERWRGCLRGERGPCVDHDGCRQDSHGMGRPAYRFRQGEQIPQELAAEVPDVPAVASLELAEKRPV